MKKILLFTIALSVIVGCSKEQMESSRVDDPVISTSVKEKAKKDFSIILSRAVSSDKNLRLFIKEMAMNKFDMDYDVFYPYVKDMTVSGDNKTFRDVLLQYSDNSSRLEEIEKELPLLTILVPDWSCLGCFSILKWEPESSKIAVGYETTQKEKPIYAEGELVGELADGAIPDFPVLIVKDSDRMRQKCAMTRAGDVSYEFVDDVFNASLRPQTKVEHRYQDVFIDGTPDISNFMSEDNVPEILKKTYDKLKDSPYAIQRDYIYFGILPDQPIGKENPHVKEYIHKIRFTNLADNGYVEDSDDFVAKGHKWEYKKNDSPKSAQELRDHFYSDGGIELKLTIIVPHKDGSVLKTEKMISANFGDVFAIDHADLDYRHKTWFCKDWYVYTIEDSYIKPKWFTVDLDLPRWHLASDSDVISIYIEEVDPSEEIEKEISVTYNESETNEVGGGGDVGINGGVSASGSITVNHSHASSSSKSETIKVKTMAGSDELGVVELDFTDPVVSGKSQEIGKNGYYIKTVSTGSCELMIMPKEI